MTILAFILDDCSSSMDLLFPHGRGFTNTTSNLIRYTRFHAAIEGINEILDWVFFHKKQFHPREGLQLVLFKTSDKGDLSFFSSPGSTASSAVKDKAFHEFRNFIKSSQLKLLSGGSIDALLSTFHSVYRYFSLNSCFYSNDIGVYLPLNEPCYLFAFTSSGFCSDGSRFLQSINHRFNYHLIIFLFTQERYLKHVSSHVKNSKRVLFESLCSSLSVSTLYELFGAIGVSFGITKGFKFENEERYKSNIALNHVFLPFDVSKAPCSRFRLYFIFKEGSKEGDSNLTSLFYKPMGVEDLNRFHDSLGRKDLESFIRKYNAKLGFWPIPFDNIQSSRFPTIYWRQVNEEQVKQWSQLAPNIAFSKHELDRNSVLVKRFLSIKQQSNEQISNFLCYASLTHFKTDKPFGYIRSRSGTKDQFWLYLLPFDFIRHVYMVNLFFPTLVLPPSSQHIVELEVNYYLNTVPQSYYIPLKEICPKYCSSLLSKGLIKGIDSKKLNLYNSKSFVMAMKQRDVHLRLLKSMRLDTPNTTKAENETNGGIDHTLKVSSNAFDIKRKELLNEWNHRIQQVYKSDITIASFNVESIVSDRITPTITPTNTERTSSTFRIEDILLEYETSTRSQKDKAVYGKTLIPQTDAQKLMDRRNSVPIVVMSDHKRREEKRRRESLRPVDEELERRLEETKFGNPYRLLDRKMKAKDSQLDLGIAEGMNPDNTSTTNNSGGKRNARVVSRKRIENNSKYEISASMFSDTFALIESLTELSFNPVEIKNSQSLEQVLSEEKAKYLDLAIVADGEIIESKKMLEGNSKKSKEINEEYEQESRVTSPLVELSVNTEEEEVQPQQSTKQDKQNHNNSTKRQAVYKNLKRLKVLMNGTTTNKRYRMLVSEIEQISTEQESVELLKSTLIKLEQMAKSLKKTKVVEYLSGEAMTAIKLGKTR